MQSTDTQIQIQRYTDRERQANFRNTFLSTFAVYMKTNNSIYSSLPLFFQFEYCAVCFGSAGQINRVYMNHLAKRRARRYTHLFFRMRFCLFQISPQKSEYFFYTRRRRHVGKTRLRWFCVRFFSELLFPVQ